jgi:hypothetical protein
MTSPVNVLRSISLFAVCLSAFAQQMTGPVLGLVFDANIHGIRPIRGIPGAATMGDPFDIGVDIQAAAISPRQNYALVVTGESRQAGLFLPSAAAIKPLDGVTGRADRIVLSPEGLSAVIYSSVTRTAQVVTGLPDSPSAPQLFDLSALNADPSQLAVTDDGAVVLASTSNPEAIAISSTSGVNRLPLSASISSFAFLSNTHDAVLVTANDASLIRDVLHPAARTLFDVLGAAGSMAVSLSSDNRRVFFANPSGQIVISTISAGSAPVTLDCRCSPAALTRIKGLAAYQISAYTGDPLSLLDAASESPRILTVPPPATPNIQP